MAPVICGLYVGGETLSLLALQPQKKGFVVCGGAADFHTAGENDDLSPAIKALCRPLKLTRQAEVTAVLPKKQAILRNVLLPSTDKDELAQMARFEAERHIPFHAERHSTGYHVLRSMGVEGSEVLLGAVDSPIVQRQLDGIADAGLTPAGATLSSVCLLNSFMYHRRDYLKGKSVAILSLGLDALDLVFVSDGRLLFARSVGLDLRGVLENWLGHTPDASGPRPEMSKLALAARMIDCTNLDGNYGAGGAPTAEAAGLIRTWIDRVIQEMRRTYDFARREMKCPPVEAVVLTGEGAVLRNLTQYLYVNMNVEVTAFNPIEGLARKQAAKFPFDGYEFAVPFGAAVAAELDGAYRMDLTPQEHYRKQAHKQMMKQLVGTSVLLVITLGLCVGAWLRHQAINQQLLETYAAINKRMDARVGTLRERSAKVAIINDFMKDPNSALNVADAVAETPALTNGRVALIALSYTKSGQDERGQVELEADAKTMNDYLGFIQELMRTRRFAEVQRPQDASPGMINQQAMYTFKLECPLVGSSSAEAGEKGN